MLLHAFWKFYHAAFLKPYPQRGNPKLLTLVNFLKNTWVVSGPLERETWPEFIKASSFMPHILKQLFCLLFMPPVMSLR